MCYVELVFTFTVIYVVISPECVASNDGVYCGGKRAHDQHSDVYSCKLCSSCADDSVVISHCNGTHDTVCQQCWDYEKRKLVEQDACKLCSPCQKGEYVVKPCTLTSRTVCAPCPYGSFIDFSGYKRTCQPCRSCLKSNLVTTKLCSSANDTVCGGCRPGFYKNPSFTNCNRCVPCSPGQIPSEECVSSSPSGGRHCRWDYFRKHSVAFSGTGYEINAMRDKENNRVPRIDKDAISKAPFDLFETFERQEVVEATGKTSVGLYEAKQTVFSESVPVSPDGNSKESRENFIVLTSIAVGSAVACLVLYCIVHTVVVKNRLVDCRQRDRKFNQRVFEHNEKMGSSASVRPFFSTVSLDTKDSTMSLAPIQFESKCLGYV